MKKGSVNLTVELNAERSFTLVYELNSYEESMRGGRPIVEFPLFGMIMEKV